MYYSIRKILSRSNNEKFIYVLINVANTFVRFAKGFIFIKYLTFKDLGLLNLISSIIGLFSIFQLGLLNGGYRIFSVEDKNRWVANDTIFSYFFLIFCFLLFGSIGYLFLGYLNFIQFVMVTFGLIFGMLSILNNWLRNILIAEKKLKQININEMISIFISFIFLFFVPYYGIIAALMVLFSIEVIFFLLTVKKNINYLPKKFSLKIKNIKWILSFGFLPFLGGLITNLTNQIETWSIVGFIGLESLGIFYLPTLYISLFLLIPLSIDKVYFPLVMKNFASRNIPYVKSIIKRYMVINISISILIILLTLILLKPIIEYLIPKHLVGIRYIWWLIPGLTIYVIFQPLRLIFNGIVNLKPFFWASTIAFLFSTFSLLTFGFSRNLTLNYVTIIKSMTYIIQTSVFLYFFVIERKCLYDIN